MENSRYSGNAVWENTRCQDIPTSTYSKLAKVDFEGRKFWGLAEYDYFLTMCYGDYMTPPPVEQQRGIHIAHCYYKD